MSTDVDGSNSDIKGDTNVVKTGGQLTYDVTFYETEAFSTLEVTYSVRLVDKDGKTQPGAVSPSSGTLYNGVATKLTVDAPKTPGKYTMTVEFSEKIDDKDAIKTKSSVVVTVVAPTVLSVNLINNSSVDFTDLALYFYVDGKLIDGSKTLVDVISGKESKASYDWVTDSLSKGSHTFKVMAGEDSLVDISGLGVEHTFQVGETNYSLFSALMAIFLVILVIIAVYVYRKPVKNYGKPKSRR